MKAPKLAGIACTMAILLSSLFFSCGDKESCCDVPSNKFLANTQEEFKRLIANPNADIIRSVADFEKKCQSNTAPFSKLNLATIKEFERYVVFKDNGLSTARYDMIERKLSRGDFILFFEAFGLSELFMTDYIGYACLSQGDCEAEITHICTGNC